MNPPYVEQVYGPELEQLKTLLSAYSDNNRFEHCFAERLLNPAPAGKYQTCRFKNEFDYQFEHVFGKKSQQTIG